MSNKFTSFKTGLYLFITLQLTLSVFAQERTNPEYNRDTLLTAAKNMIKVIPNCTLVTLDTTGNPSARTMDPFLPDDEFVVWLGTNIQSRKVKEIKNDSRVSLYYQAPNNPGYVLIKGQAYIIDNSLMKLKYWKKEWSRFYPNNKSNYTLIKVVPEKLEIIDYQHGIFGDSETWAVPYVEFKSGK